MKHRHTFPTSLFVAFLVLATGQGAAAQVDGMQKADGPALPTSTILKRTYYFAEAGTNMEYALFVPKGYDGTKSYPLIVALHGLGVTPAKMIRYKGLTELAQQHGYVVVVPMGYTACSGFGNPVFNQSAAVTALSEKDVMNVVERTRHELRIDATRIYLTGYSLGGGGALHLAVKYPNMWAALAAIAPATSREPDCLAKIKHVPILMVQGAKDQIVPAAGIRTWATKMKELGMTHQYIEVEGGDHFSVAEESLPAVFAFFNQHPNKEVARN